MPDHAPRPTREPPWIFDRLLANVLSVRDCALSALGGCLVGVDALAADVVVSPSGVILYPPPGSSGSGTVRIVPDPNVADAYLIGE